MADRRCLEGLRLFKPPGRTVVASGGSKSSKNQGVGFCRLLWPTVVASGGSKSSKNGGLGFFEPLRPIVVASSGSKHLKIED